MSLLTAEIVEPVEASEKLEDRSLPDRVNYILIDNGPYVCCGTIEGIKGMLIFPNFGIGRMVLSAVMEQNVIKSGKLIDVEFDEALDVAKSRPDPVIAVHFVTALEGDVMKIANTQFVK